MKIDKYCGKSEICRMFACFIIDNKKNTLVLSGANPVGKLCALTVRTCYRMRGSVTSNEGFAPKCSTFE